MSKWQKEFANVFSWPGMLIAAYLLLLLGTIVTSDKTRSLVNYSELAMMPVAVMVTYLAFQREIGSGFMEILATYPLSLPRLLLHKWLLSILTFTACHAVVVGVYYWQFQQLKMDIYPWQGGESVWRTVSWWEVYVQALPGFLFMSALAVFGFMVTRQVYGGLILPFGYWLLEMLMGGLWLPLHTMFLQETDTFVVNRLSHIVAAVVLIGLSLVLFNRRTRWITAESDVA